MQTPRIPPLRMIDEQPQRPVSPRIYQPFPTPAKPISGYLGTMLAFALLLFGLFSSAKIVPGFHLPVWSEAAILLSFPTLLFGTYRLS